MVVLLPRVVIAHTTLLSSLSSRVSSAILIKLSCGIDAWVIHGSLWKMVRSSFCAPPLYIDI